MHGRMLIVGAICALALLSAQMTSAHSSSSLSAVAATAANHCSQAAAIRHRSKGQRVLASADVSKIQRYCRAALPHIHTLNFWFSRQHRWMLYLRHWSTKCAALPEAVLQGPRHLCYTARQSVREHSRNLASLDRQIKALLPNPGELNIRHDLALANARRFCIAGVETNHAPVAYTEVSPSGTYTGKYQYDNHTWQTALSRAEAYYHVNISTAAQANQALPWAQDVVTSFAIEHSNLLGWDPWAECR